MPALPCPYNYTFQVSSYTKTNMSDYMTWRLPRCLLVSIKGNGVRRGFRTSRLGQGLRTRLYSTQRNYYYYYFSTHGRPVFVVMKRAKRGWIYWSLGLEQERALWPSQGVPQLAQTASTRNLLLAEQGPLPGRIKPFMGQWNTPQVSESHVACASSF